MYVEYTNKKGEVKRMKLYHMVQGEMTLASAFIKRYGNQYISFDTDITVGTIIEPTVQWDGRMQEGYSYLMAKKIDLIGYREKEIHVFEVKVRGGHSLVGQVLLYMKLFRERFNPREEVKGGCICAYIDPDVKKFLEENGILIYEFDEFKCLLA